MCARVKGREVREERNLRETLFCSLFMLQHDAMWDRVAHKRASREYAALEMFASGWFIRKYFFYLLAWDYQIFCLPICICLFYSNVNRQSDFRFSRKGKLCKLVLLRAKARHWRWIRSLTLRERKKIAWLEERTGRSFECAKDFVMQRLQESIMEHVKLQCWCFVCRVERVYMIQKFFRNFAVKSCWA